MAEHLGSTIAAVVRRGVDTNLAEIAKSLGSSEQALRLILSIFLDIWRQPQVVINLCNSKLFRMTVCEGGGGRAPVSLRWLGSAGNRINEQPCMISCALLTLSLYMPPGVSAKEVWREVFKGLTTLFFLFILAIKGSRN